jgi:hypothetical protein
VRGEEARPGTAVSGDSRVRTGPRHAAPRKSLLTKLQIPAGKAIALAAMPTAVFVGMGLTPKLAQADEMPGNPFAPGPCVTRSDEPEPKESPSASESAKHSKSAKPSSKPSAEPSPSESRSADATDKVVPKPGASPSAEDVAGKAAEETPSAVPSPTESERRNPLDPLGVGDKLKDLFDGPDEEPSPTASSSAPHAEKPSTSTAPPELDGTSAKPLDDAQQKTKEAIKDAADQVGAKVEEVKDAAKAGTSGKDGEAGENGNDGKGGKGGKEPFPCPTHDPEALAAADLEPGVPLLPDAPWRLETSQLTLRGLDYHGIVEVKTYSGKVKKVLKFTADETDIKDLHQLVDGPLGTTAHVAARKGSTSTIRGGTVTMYTEELKGNLFGLIPVTFSPETPPPLNVPFAFFTDVKVVQAGQFGGTLTVPGLHSYTT